MLHESGVLWQYGYESVRSTHLLPGAAIRNTNAVLHQHLPILNLKKPSGNSQLLTICFHYTQKVLHEEGFNKQQNVLANVHIN